ncbi:hypothetical protein HK104_006031 [Borealophlyctis nickersoniae]|nr:hypothetical protein HK104_006031 [Borealophlyctis nickersoniae]
MPRSPPPALTTLPTELLLQIATHIPRTSLPALFRSYRSLSSLSHDPALWSHRARTDFNFSTSATLTISWRTIYKRLMNPLLLTWGEWTDGRLGRTPPRGCGNPHAGDWHAIPGVVKGANGLKVVKVGCCGWGVVVVDLQGRVWVFGRVRNEEMWSARKVELQVPEGKRVKEMVCGRGFVLCLADDGEFLEFDILRIGNKYRNQKHRSSLLGKIYSFSSVKNPPALIPLPSTPPVTQLFACWDHGLALTSISTMYTWAAHTQLSPSDIRAVTLLNTRITCIAATSRLGAALTSSGEVYTWSLTGEDPIHRLHEGLTHPDNTHISGSMDYLTTVTSTGAVRVYNMQRNTDMTPLSLRQPSTSSSPVVQVVSGDYHHGLLRYDGSLETWGEASAGARGDGVKRGYAEKEPKKVVKGLEGLILVKVAMGGWHSAALAIAVGEEEEGLEEKEEGTGEDEGEEEDLRPERVWRDMDW